MPAKISFAPGEVIRSTETNTNFSLIFNKPILIPFSVAIGAQVGITTYALAPAERLAILALAPLGATPTMSSLLTLGDIIDMEDGTGPLATPIIDKASEELIRGTIVAPLNNSAVNITFSHAVTGTNVNLLIPVHTVFNALPEDFLRREFVSSLESDDPIRKMMRGRLTTAEETTLVATLGASDGGIFWFCTTDSQMKCWNGATISIMG